MWWRRQRALVAAGLLSFAVGGGATALADVQFPAQVVRVKDGDSLVLRSTNASYEARLGEIDAPEYNQPWGKAARRALSRLTIRKQVSVAVQDIDRYGRLVVQLQADGVNVNRHLVANGHAWVYRDYLRTPELLEIEAQARQQGVGLWSQPGAVAPWLYRRGERKPTPPDTAVGSLWNAVSASTRRVTEGFGCGRKTYCSQMNSCGEAYFYLQHCGLTRLDGDGDGKPCERIC